MPILSRFYGMVVKMYFYSVNITRRIYTQYMRMNI